MGLSIEQAAAQFSAALKAEGLPGIAVLDPHAIRPQPVNARYMDSQKLANLIANLKRDGKLESTPLVVLAPDGVYEAVSGHHRVEAAIKAGLPKILCMETEVESPQHLRAKQLSHNALAGQDDPVVLTKLYDSLEALDLKFYSGLADQLESINVVNLSFKAANFKEFVVAFLPEDIEKFDAACDLVEQLSATSGTIVRLAPIAAFDTFTRAIREVKKVENVKSNGTALSVLLDIALAGLEEERTRRQEQDRDEVDRTVS